MRPVLIMSAFLFLASGCDVFVPDVGGAGQQCSNEDTCKEGLHCTSTGVCCRNHWDDHGDNCGYCPPNWDAEQDCNACLGNWDPAQDCTACLGNWDIAQYCDACLDHWQDNDDDCGTCAGNWDIAQNCQGCIGNWDPNQDCNACLNQWQDNNDDCGTCPAKWDPARDCNDCVGNWDPAQSCTVCQNQWVDNSDDCGTCPGKWDAAQDCAECIGNWDKTQDCTVCEGNWVDNSDDCGTCPGKWDAAQDCAECLGNWDEAQDCTVCEGKWVDNNDDCGTCVGNWDPDQGCEACRTNWIDRGDDCGTCPLGWDPAQDCNVCLAEWSGEFCEKVTDCTGKPDFTICENPTDPDYYYDICVQGECTSPGCGLRDCNAPGPHFTLADTSQRSCYDNGGRMTSCVGDAGEIGCISVAFCGQDAQYGWDIDSQGSPRYNRTVPVTDQPVVEDLVTGLVWQGCADDRSGDICQNDSTGGRNWGEALNYCDGLDWGGFTDWRLPDEYELLSIVDYSNEGGSGQAIDSGTFPQTSPEHFWTSSTAFGDQAYAIALEFGWGSMEADHKDSGGYHFRCVRNGPQVAGGATGPRFTVDDSDPTQPVVTDNVTGLDWQGCLDGMTGVAGNCTGTLAEHQWQAALTRCEELDWGGHQDWYLPNIKQLHSITFNRGGNPAIDTNIFPGPPNDVCWSSTTMAGEMQKAWVVDFSIGGLVIGGNYNNKSDGRAVRCVRDGL